MGKGFNNSRAKTNSRLVDRGEIQGAPDLLVTNPNAFVRKLLNSNLLDRPNRRMRRALNIKRED
jgi:hypothetical protein